MIHIYQVLGNLARYHKNEYKIENKAEELSLVSGNSISFLSSVDLFKRIGSKDKKIIFLKPKSLGDVDMHQFTNGIHDNYYEVVEIPSFGVMNNRNYDYYPPEILLSIFLDMIGRVKIDDTLFIDTSTGLNEYVISMISALDYAMVTSALNNIDKEKAITAYTVTSTPIFGNMTGNATLFIDRYYRKVFFSLPYEENDFPLGSLVDCKDRNSTYCKKEFNGRFLCNKHYKDSIDNLKILYNAIKLNTLPFISELHELINDEYKKLLSRMINELIIQFNEVLADDNRDAKINNVYRVINFIMNLKFYLGIIDLLQPIVTDMTSLEKLGEIGKKIYYNKIINLHSNFEFLHRDIVDLTTNGHHNSEKSGEEKNTRLGSSVQRNFFAHSGMDMTSCSVCHNKIIYKSERKEERRKWLLTANSMN